MPKPTTNNVLTTVSEMFREHFEPETIAILIAYLQPADSYQPTTDKARRAATEIEWLSETLTGLFEPGELNRLMNELGL